MQEMTDYACLQDAVALGDSFALLLVEYVPHMQEVVDADMKLTQKVFRVLRTTAPVQEVRSALVAAGRLQGLALLFQATTAIHYYSELVAVLIRWLEDIDRTIQRRW